MYKRFLELSFWIVFTILTTYYVPKFIQPALYIIMLIAYYRSKNEPMWLAIFLVLSDGFLGFFNNYEVVLAVIPGLPPIEMGHFYVLFSIIKATRYRPPGRFFFNTLLGVLTVYLGFLIVQSYVLGLNPAMNVQFRLLKTIFPLGLFYAIPRLFRTEEDYRSFFAYMFPFAFTTLFAQVFTIVMHMSPSQFLGVHRKFWFTVDVNTGRTYRGFYSTATVLSTYFGSMYYLAHRGKNFNQLYLFAVLGASLMAAFLSATRGWVVGMSLSLILFLFFVVKLSGKQVSRLALSAALILISLMAIPIVNKQISLAIKRMTTLEALASGDRTAKGTLSRITERSPRVMNKWIESPLTGWGFSDTFTEYQDFHVGNQNILLHSGILGAALLGMFFVYFHGKLFFRSTLLPRGHPLKEALLTFGVFFPGWFFIHSSSGQQFAYYQDPGQALVFVPYLYLGGLTYLNTISQPEQSAVPPTENT